MKFVLVLASFIVFSKATSEKEFKDTFMQKLHEIGAKCMGEVNASEDDVAALLSHQLPTTHEGKCMIFCMHKGFKVYTEDGDFNREGALETLSPIKEFNANVYEKAVKIMDTCSSATKKEDDPCITSTNYVMCGIKGANDAGLTEELLET